MNLSMKNNQNTNRIQKSILSAHEAVALIKPNSRIACGGFLACGSAENLIDALIDRKTQPLHLIAICTDYPDRGCGKLVKQKQIKSIQTSHIGTNIHSQEQYKSGELEIEFTPQGNLIERLRAAGVGLGGILTPTGIGTSLENEKIIHQIDGRSYFLEKPIHCDFALIRAHKADRKGNLVYSKTARNSNPVMAMAAQVTIAEVDEIVEPGQLDPEQIITPGIFVQHLIVHQN